MKFIGIDLSNLRVIKLLEVNRIEIKDVGNKKDSRKIIIEDKKTLTKNSSKKLKS